MTIKVTHVVIGLNVGGAELMLKRLVGSQNSRSDVAHAVVSLTDLGVVGKELRALNVPVVSLGMKRIIDVPRVVCSLARLFKKETPDIVQTWMYHADLLGGLAARMAGVKCIIWGVRTTDLNKGGKRATLLVRKFCALLSNSLPAAIVCAAEASRKAHAAIGYNSERMVVIPNGFDLSRLHATAEQRKDIRASVNVALDEIVIGSVGRFSPVKDHVNFISAAGLLADKYTNVRFMLVGRGLDSQNRLLMRHISATGHPERFVLMGERQDVAACLKAMDIFCLHSRTEGFPNVLGEAMAMGLPCLTTDVGDASYLLDGCGAVVPAEDSLALMRGMDLLLKLGAVQRAELGRLAVARINLFTIEQMSGKFLKLYTSVRSDRGFDQA